MRNKMLYIFAIVLIVSMTALAVRFTCLAIVAIHNVIK